MSETKSKSIKKYAICASFSTLLVVGLILGINYSEHVFKAFNQNADASEKMCYMEFNKNNNVLYKEPYFSLEGSSIVYTHTEHPINFNYKHLIGSNNLFQVIGQDGYFYNTDPINGLSSITFDFSYGSGIKLSYGWKDSSETILYRVENVLINDSTPYLFNLEKPAFFRIDGNGTDMSAIKSISLSYSCIENADDNDFTYRLSNDKTHYILTGYTGSNSSIALPSSYHYKVVDVVADEFLMNNYWIREISIPSSYKTIGDRSFYSCHSLYTVKIADGITSIGYNAFSNCNSLQVINLPNTLKKINDNAFSPCPSLPSIEIPESVESIGNGAFKNCYSLRTVILHSGLQKIGSEAFLNDGSLTKITIPSTVSYIGSAAFGGCWSLSIYCDFDVQPETWDSNWNSIKRPVFWNIANHTN